MTLLHFSLALAWGILLALICQSYFQGNPERVKGEGTYRAAVVEYEPEGRPWEPGQEVIAKNVAKYVEFIRNASLEGADIIVFPEYGLTTLGMPRDRNAAKAFLLPVPEVGGNPCVESNERNSLQQLSCTAKTHNIYVVVNLGEVRNCAVGVGSCPQDGVFQFNTNVVFDRNGTVIAKYEKSNLYFEDQFDKPESVGAVTFETDFGVTFGLFTCFDIIFFDPAVRLVEQGIRNFIFPTAWVDELPFLMAIQAQATWAYASNSNLLASGYHQPLGGQLGSGIYAGQEGAVLYTFDSNSGSKMLVGNLPIDLSKDRVQGENSGSNVAAFHSFLREDLQNYSTVMLHLQSEGDERICTDNGFCCGIQYELINSPVSPTTTENFRLMAFNGTRTVAAKTSQYDWQVCALVRCLNETLASCSENSQETNTSAPYFKTLILKTRFDNPEVGPFRHMLNAMDTKFDLISPNNFEVSANLTDGYVEIFSSSLHKRELKTLALINKIFET